MPKGSTAVLYLLALQFFGILALADLGGFDDAATEDYYTAPTIDLTKELPRKLNSINIISGIPLTSTEDTNGGFGDVAANVLSALSLKEKYPDLKVTLLVTSNYIETRKGVRSSSDIVKIMIPELDSNKLDQIQQYKGLSVIFLSLDNKELRTNSLPPAIKQIVPYADLSLQFSANKSPNSVLGLETGKVGFSFFEFHPSTDFPLVSTATSTPWMDNKDRIPWLRFQSGPETTGIYKMATSTLSQSHHEIEQWANAGADLPMILSSKKIAMAYSNRVEPSVSYAKGVIHLAELNPDQDYVLFAKDDEKLRELIPPPNLVVKLAAVFPHEILKNLILASDLPPLVTGDSSLSIALSSLQNKHRLFMYDAPQWKKNFIHEFVDRSIWRLKQKNSFTIAEEELFRRAMEFGHSTITSSESPEDFALRFFEDETTQKKLRDGIISHISEKDVFQSTRLIFEFYTLFETELRTKILDDFYHILPKLIELGSWEALKRHMVEVFYTKEPQQDKERLFATILLAKFGYFKGENSNLVSFINEIYNKDYASYKILRLHGLINDDGLGRYFKWSFGKDDFNFFRDHAVTWIQSPHLLDKVEACKKAVK
jgi:hypothetical protein